MKHLLKQIVSWGVGAPAAIICASEVTKPEGVVLQLVAAVAVIGVLAWNGMFRKGLQDEC